MFVSILKECPFAFLCSSHLVAVLPELTCCKQALLCYSAFSELSLAWKHFESCCKCEDFLKFGEIFATPPWLAQWQVFWLACCILFIGRWSEALDAVLLILASQVVFGSHIPMSFVSSHSLCHSFCPYAHEGLRFMCSLHHCGGFLRVFWRRDCRICIICWWIFVPTESFWMRSWIFSQCLLGTSFRLFAQCWSGKAWGKRPLILVSPRKTQEALAFMWSLVSPSACAFSFSSLFVISRVPTAVWLAPL